MTRGAEGMTYEMELENGETFIPTNLPWWGVDEAANGGSAVEDIAALLLLSELSSSPRRSPSSGWSVTMRPMWMSNWISFLLSRWRSRC